MNKINGLASAILLATLIVATATPAFGYLVDTDSNSQDIYYYWRLVTNGYLYAATYYDQPQEDYSSIYTYLRITGYTSFGEHMTRVQLTYSPISFNDIYHDVWEFGMGTDYSTEFWDGYNPNHDTGPINLWHNTQFIGPQWLQENDGVVLTL